MKATYETSFTVPCPVDGTTDIYELRLESRETIQAETILEALKDVGRTPAFQEAVTERLAAAFPDASVVTTGTHSGVRTTVEATSAVPVGRSS